MILMLLTVSRYFFLFQRDINSEGVQIFYVQEKN